MSWSKILKSDSNPPLRGVNLVEFQADATFGGARGPDSDDFTPQALVCPLPRPEEPHPGPAVSLQDFSTMETEILQREEEAYARGLQDGLAAVETGLNQTVEAFAKAAEEISVLRRDLLQNASRDMAQLAMAIARRVIHVELSINPEVVLETIQMALQAAINSDEFRIKVNPQDFALVTERKPQMLASVSGLKNVIIESDHHVGRGGALLESDLGEVDATIESQTASIERQLLGWMEEG